MTWVRFDDTCPDHPKIAGLSDGAHRLWFDAMCYCNRMLTDGAVPRAMVAKLQPKRSEACAQILVEAGLWDATPTGFQVHDYADFQPSKAQVMAVRADKHEQKVSAGKAGAMARWKQNDSRAIAGGIAEPKQNDSPIPTRPVPNTRSHSLSTPLTPQRGERIARAKNGSGRKRDREAAVQAIQEAPLNPQCSRLEVSGQDCRRLVPTIQNGWCVSCKGAA